MYFIDEIEKEALLKSINALQGASIEEITIKIEDEYSLFTDIESHYWNKQAISNLINHKPINYEEYLEKY